jgi:hypothetical protein
MLPPTGVGEYNGLLNEAAITGEIAKIDRELVGGGPIGGGVDACEVDALSLAFRLDEDANDDMAGDVGESPGEESCKRTVVKRRQQARCLCVMQR